MASTLKVNEIQHINGTSAMTIDTAGRMLKGTGGNLVAFHAYPNANFNTSSGAYNVDTESNLIFSAVWYNYGGHYNTSTGRFVAPVDGLYQFTATMAMNSNSNTYAYLSAEAHQWAGNGSTLTRRWIGGWGSKLSGTTAYDRQQNVQTFPLAAGDGVSMGYEITTAGVPTAGGSPYYTSFVGRLIG